MKKTLRNLNLRIDNKRWRRIPGLRARLKKAAEAALAQLPKRLRFPCSITVLLTTDAVLRRLNRDFRGLNKPTNVLSFPQFAPRELTKKGKNRGVVYMGDIALSYQYMVYDAKKNNNILINHATHLLIHGILHLFGYDHGSGAEAARMQRLEKRVMAGLGLPDPYAPQPKEPKARPL